MTGARALLCGTFILAAVCALPAVSAAQDSGTVPDTTTTTVPEPPATPASEPSKPAASPGGTNAKPGGGGGGGGQSAASQPDSSTPAPQVNDRLAHASATTRVTMGDNFFSPATVTIHAGDIVTWRNNGNSPHTATADDGSFDTGTLTTGQSASHMFSTPGTFTYVCTIHANMKGTVRVLAASGSAGSGGGGGGGGTASSSGSAPTEAQAVASPNAAADKNSLAATGMAAGFLALVGAAMLACGVAVRYVGRPAAAEAAGLPAPALVPPPVGSTKASSRSALLSLALLAALVVVGSQRLRRR